MPANSSKAGQPKGRQKNQPRKASAVDLGRAPNGKFQKGMSGNPNGRPLIAFELRDAARAHAPSAIEKLVFWMNCPDPQYSIQACKILLDRGFGKPVQTVAGNANSAPQVNLNFAGTTITTAEEAQRVYEMISRDSTIDTSQIKFIPAEKKEPTE